MGLMMIKCFITCRHSALRVAYIDETEDTKGGKKVYYSVLVKGGEKYDQVWRKNILSYLHDLNQRSSLLCIIIVLKYLVKYFNTNVSLSNI
jgi:hypothetical protein